MEDQTQEEPDEEILGPEEADDIVGMCADCLTVLPDESVGRDVFFKNNSGNPICKMCGGPVVIISARSVEAARNKRRSGRSI